MFTGAVKLELVNLEHRWGRPHHFVHRDAELGCALDSHKALTAGQIGFLGYPRKRLGKMVKYGFLYRYKIFTREGTLPSAFTLGPAAARYMKLALPEVSSPEKLQSLLALNQVLLCLRRLGGSVTVDPGFPRAVFLLTRPTAVIAPRHGFYPEMLGDCPQGMVMLPDRKLARPDLPVRYCFDGEAEDPGSITFYRYTSAGGLRAVELSHRSAAENTV